MTLTRSDVESIARLARLALTDAELSAYADSLSRILDFVAELNAADTADIEPMAHPLESQVQRLRPDAVTETDGHERYQQNAAATAAGLYLVPKVIE
jgi:aspartyl-tRNA(Asn)/glutamyl-tRNA(Gln) amidotransferase subunit C